MNKESLPQISEKTSSKESSEGSYENSKSKIANYTIKSAFSVFILTGLFLTYNTVKNNNKENMNDKQESTTIEVNETIQDTNVDNNEQDSNNILPEDKLTTKELEILPTTDEETLEFEEEEGREMTKGANELEENYPLIKSLPIHARLYSIDICKSEKESNIPIIAICVDSNQKKEDIEPYVKKHVSSLGYNLDDYEVRWTESP